MAVRLSVFGDELAHNLDEQLTIMGDAGIRYLDVRTVNGRNVLEFSEAEARQLHTTLEEQGFAISSLGSPIGKTSIRSPFEAELSRFQHALSLCSALRTAYLRIFSFYVPAGQAEDYRNEVLRRLERCVKEADGRGVTLLLENEKGLYGDTPARCLDILQALEAPHLRHTWDAANYVQVGSRPWTEGAALLPYVANVHVKDARFEDGVVVPAGQGDGQLRPFLTALKAHGYEGFLALEPHLAMAGERGGFTGPELFQVAMTALKGLLEELNW